MMIASLSPSTVARTSSGTVSCRTPVAPASTRDRRRTGQGDRHQRPAQRGCRDDQDHASASSEHPAAHRPGRGGAEPAQQRCGRARRTRARPWPARSPPRRPTRSPRRSAAGRARPRVDQVHRSHHRDRAGGRRATQRRRTPRRSHRVRRRVGCGHRHGQDQQGAPGPSSRPATHGRRSRVAGWSSSPPSAAPTTKEPDLDGDQQVGGRAALVPAIAGHRRHHGRVRRGRDGDGQGGSQPRRARRGPSSTATAVASSARRATSSVARTIRSRRIASASRAVAQEHSTNGSIRARRPVPSSSGSSVLLGDHDQQQRPRQRQREGAEGVRDDRPAGSVPSRACTSGRAGSARSAAARSR